MTDPRPAPAQRPEKEAEADWTQLKPRLLKFGLELGPLVIFFLVNARGKNILERFPGLQSWFSEPIILATGVFMVAMLVSLVLSKLLMDRLPIMPLVTAVVVLVFGGLTLAFQDSLFIKIKPTITNCIFGFTLLGGLWFKQSLLRYVFGEFYHLQERGWYVLTVRWGLFFLFLAAVNEIVWRNFTDDFWIAFKVWGVMPITMLFAIAQVPALTRYSLETDQDAPQSKPAD